MATANITFATTEAIFSEDYILNRENLISALHPLANVLGAMRRASLAGLPSDSQRFPKPPVIAAAAVADGTDITNTTYTPTQITLTVGEIGVMVTPTDLNTMSNIFGGAGQYGRDLGLAIRDKMTTDITLLWGAFSNFVGTTGVDLTELQFRNAITTLRATDVNAPLCAGLAPQQLEDLVTSVGSTVSAASTTGTSARQATNDMGGIPGDGDAGMMYGVEVIVNNTVGTLNAAADYGGGMFEKGAALAHVGKYASRLETDRDASLRATEWVATAAYSVGEIDDDRGVSIITDV